MTSNIVNVLWTSGWDSTFRVASLMLLEGKTVQPWYIKDARRRSTQTELRTMDLIREALEQKDPTVRERLLPTKTVAVRDIPADPEVTGKFKSLLERSFLGSQIDFLARFAKWQGINLELNIHRDDTAHAFLEGSVEKRSDGSYRLRDDVDDALTLYLPFSFPIFEYTKLDMENVALENRFEDIMEMTWFCHYPLLDGTACGRCNPCSYTKEEGLGRRVPKPSLPRTAQYVFVRVFWAIRNRIYSLLCKTVAKFE